LELRGDDRDVVGTAGGIGGRDQAVAAGFDRRGTAQVLEQRTIVDVTGQTVRAEDDLVSLGELDAGGQRDGSIVVWLICRSD
jgi:hypothetical protein